MKEVILSADDEAVVYLVPDEVADQLAVYCTEFAGEWIWKSPHAQKYHRIVNGIDGVCYGAPDFIDYLNKWMFPEQPSSRVRGLGCYDDEIPEEYRNHPKFNF